MICYQFIVVVKTKLSPKRETKTADKQEQEQEKLETADPLWRTQMGAAERKRRYMTLQSLL